MSHAGHQFDNVVDAHHVFVAKHLVGEHGWTDDQVARTHPADLAIKHKFAHSMHTSAFAEYYTAPNHEHDTYGAGASFLRLEG